MKMFDKISLIVVFSFSLIALILWLTAIFYLIPKLKSEPVKKKQQPEAINIVEEI